MLELPLKAYTGHKQPTKQNCRIVVKLQKLYLVENLLAQKKTK